MIKQKPTESELEILTVLWEYGPSTVRFVNEEINKRKKSGYTTTLKFMQIMLDKNLVKRKRNGKSHVYTSMCDPEETRGVILENILDKAFAGSASKLVRQAICREKTTKREINEIIDYLSSKYPLRA